MQAAEQARAKAEKEVVKQAGAGCKCSKVSQALEGCSTFNLGLSTLSTSQPIAGPASVEFSTPTRVLLDFQVGFPPFFLGLADDDNLGYIFKNENMVPTSTPFQNVHAHTHSLSIVWWLMMWYY